MVASFEDRQDFEDAERGRINALDPCVVRAADGRVIWDLEAYTYLDGECPDTVNPSLWRQAQLCAKHGALIQTENPRTQAAADLTLTLTKPQLLGLLAGRGLDGIEHTGDPAALSKLMGLLDTPDPAFPIITP